MGFRAFTARLGQDLRLKGWVRNLLDGRVEAVAKGPADVLQEFERRLRQGPKHGRVDTMVVGAAPGEDVIDFEVRKDGRQPCVN